MYSDIKAGIRWIIDNTGVDEALIEFFRTFVTVSISVACSMTIASSRFKRYFRASVAADPTRHCAS